jgi:hypothetical protein
MSTPPATILVAYENEPVARVSAESVEFLPATTQLAPGEARLRLVMYMVRYAELVARGERPAPYDDEDAERFARRALIDPTELAAHCADSDEQLAGRFRLPAEQLAKARRELLLTDDQRVGQPGLNPWGDAA